MATAFSCAGSVTPSDAARRIRCAIFALVADNEIDRLGQGRTTGMILVPRIPTKEMIEAAYYDAMVGGCCGGLEEHGRSLASNQHGKFRFGQRLIAAFSKF